MWFGVLGWGGHNRDVMGEISVVKGGPVIAQLYIHFPIRYLLHNSGYLQQKSSKE